MHATLCQHAVTIVQLQSPPHSTYASDFKAQLTATNISAHQDSILLVDLAQIESIDSSGLMALVLLLQQSQEIGRRLILCSVSPAIRIIFELTQMDRVFEIFDNRAAFQAKLCSSEIAPLTAA